MNLVFSVHGRDHYHDRGCVDISAATATEAARKYLCQYVEDWRGGSFGELRLMLGVRLADGDEGEQAFVGTVTAQPGSGDKSPLMFRIQQEDQNAQD